MIHRKFQLCGWLAILLASVAGAQEGDTSGAPPAQLLECVHDESVQERFIPVEMMTGEPIPAEPVLQLHPVQRDYPFVYAKKGENAMLGRTVLSGPVEQQVQGKTVQVYERKVPKAYERVALTNDQTAMGRVFDERIGNVSNEGKFPVGLWKQGARRQYSTVLHLPQGDRSLTTSILIEKLSCTYDGVPGSLQIRWQNTRGLDYIYVFAPGRGLVQVINQGR